MISLGPTRRVRRIAFICSLAAVSVILLIVIGQNQMAAGDSVNGTTKSMLTCGDEPFSPSVFDRPANAEKAKTPLGRGLRKVIRSSVGFPGRKSGWRLIFKSKRHAQFMNETSFGGTTETPWIALEKEKGRWEFSGTGGCQPQPYRPDAVAARWIPSPNSTIDYSTKVLKLDVTEQSCASGQKPGKRMLPAEVDYRSDAIVVTFFVRPLGGGLAVTCQGNPSVLKTVRLDEALGDRMLLDGSEYPPVPRQ